MKKEKVLFVSYNAVTDSVAQSQVIPYVEKLASMGVDISLLTFEKTWSSLEENQKIGFNSIKGQLNKAKIPWHRLRYHKRPSLPATLFDIFQGVILVFYLILKQKVSIIHARMVVPAAMCFFLRKFLRFKWVYDMRGLVAEEYVGHGSWRDGGLKFRLVKSAEKRCLLSADYITVLTYKQKENISGLDFMRNKKINIDVIPCCVNTDRFRLGAIDKDSIRKKFGLLDKFVLIYIGSLGTCYLLSEMIDFFICLKEKVSNAYFLFAANSGKELILETMREKNLKGEDFGIINVPFEEMPGVVSTADIGIYFINPYRKFGSFPIKFAEYLASGVPVVINKDIGDTEDITRDKKVGVVIEELNEGEYRNAIDRLLEMLKETEALRRICSSVATEELSLRQGAQKYYDVYSRLVI
ncbi:MAG: glycosyltransferase family 4 protein [Candidatus Omnitrophica bacterium]|nr:glycosyltransferase family 4 protein [Candidatus Omnitrophota bacterium]